MTRVAFESLKLLAEINPEAVRWTYCDDAIIGVAKRKDTPVLVYEREKLLMCFMGMGMNEQQADEWVSFNIDGAWLGENTPLMSDFSESSPKTEQ